MVRQVYILVGPTAVGKSEIAMFVAEKLNAWIISADSRQVYIGMNIGTAKPSETDRQKIKHLLIDIVSPDHVFSVAEFMDAANDAIKLAFSNDKNVLIVGGTGLYVRALIEGFDLANTPRMEEIHEKLVNRFEELGLESLVQELHEIDPVAYEKLDLNNPHRVIRALEIIKATGKPLVESRSKNRPDDYEFKVIGLKRDREYLNERIRQRTYAMVHAGWIDEVRKLLSLKYPENSPAMTGIGYQEIRQYLNGDITMDYAVERTIIRTRQYAKRQMTWFRAESWIDWYELAVDNNPVQDAHRIVEIFTGSKD